MNRQFSAFAFTASAVLLAASARAQAPAAAAPAAPTAPSPVVDPPPAAPDSKLAEAVKEISVQRADIDDQDRRINELESELKAVKQPKVEALKAAPAAPVTAPQNGEQPLKLSGYAQAQYEFHQDSEDQLLSAVVPLNQNRFVLRRVRFKVEKEWTYGGTLFELDANTVRGPAIGLQHAEVSLAYRNPDRSPLAGATLGLFDNPFGREVVESPRERPFMERSTGSRAFFPAEPDLGLRIAGRAAWLRYSVAVVNGQPLGDRTGFILQDPNSHKDVLGRVGVDVTLPPAVHVTGGVSLLDGRGFHAGSDATKNQLVWKDLNENGQFDNGEFVTIPGTAATKSQNFKRWAIGADLGFDVESSQGTTKLYGEAMAGSNMDRNVFIADPVTTSSDARELSYYLEIIHEFKHGLIAAFRYDSYNPNSDFLDSHAGKLVPATQTVTTYSPLVGFQVPHRARVVAEWDIVRDSLARDVVGVPVDKKNNVVTIRLQGEL